jgi:hypothetical protein
MRTTLEKFQEQGGRLRTDDLDFDAFVDQPLDVDVLRCLAYMHDIEYQTVLYTRELLLTAAYKDPQMTGFLTLWNYEEYWHGQALGRVLEMHGRPAHDERLTSMRRWNKRYLGYSPVIFFALGKFVRQFPVVHMTWGAINEWTANAAYNRLSQVADHPVLSELLGRIMRQEGRHAAFYASWARDGLEGDRRAQRVTRWFLTHEWAVVGTGDVPQVETSFTSAYLFGSGDGAELVDRIEDRIDALPGLAGLGLVRKGIAEANAHLITEEGRVPAPAGPMPEATYDNDASRAVRPVPAVAQNA